MKKITKILAGLVLTGALSLNLIAAPTTTTYYGHPWVVKLNLGCWGTGAICAVVIAE